MPNYYEKHRHKVMAKLVRGESILDIGCAKKPNVYLRGNSITGIDQDKMDLQSPYTEHLVGDINNIDNILAGRKFCTVLMGEFIEHIERPYDILRLIHKYLVPGGRLILSTPNPLGIPVIIAEYLCFQKLYHTEHVFYFSPRLVRRLLERSRYKVIKTVGCGAAIGNIWVPHPVSFSYIVVYVATSV